jgi:predicted unusual protein kinase regulating ubiquinone biosynthesis (AarF/ABC1/UbiB family)
MLLSPRFLQRLAATVGLFTRYGLSGFAEQQGLRGLSTEYDGEDAEVEGHAVAFRKRLVELGPAYIKLGQVLSTRADLLPTAYIEELATLQDSVDPIPLGQVESTIEQELGGRLSKLFAEFDPDPLGTASLGQAHAARLRDGRAVVVKVQRPRIREDLADDIEFFHELASFLAEHTAAGQRMDLLGIVHQLEQALVDELDYRVEARNGVMFRRSLAEFPRILVPRVIERYSTERVLTTERIRGEKFSEVSALARLEHDFNPLADALTRAYLKQITIDGHFHADPHPGNVFVIFPESDNPATPAEARAADRRSVARQAVTPMGRLEAEAQRHAADVPDDIDVKVALIDFGMTARLSTRLRQQVVRLLLDLSDARGDDAAEALIEIGSELPDFDRHAFVREIGAVMARHQDSKVTELDAGKLLYQLINISYQRGLRLPAELTLLAKTLLNLDSVARSIDPTFSPIPTIRDFGAQIAADRVKRDLNPRRLFQVAAETGELAMVMPHRIDLISARLAANDFQVRVDVPQLLLTIEALQKVANRVFSGLVLAGLLIASAMLIQYRRALGTAGFLLAGVVGLWMVLAIVWSDRHHGAAPQS